MKIIFYIFVIFIISLGVAVLTVRHNQTQESKIVCELVEKNEKETFYICKDHK